MSFSDERPCRALERFSAAGSLAGRRRSTFLPGQAWGRSRPARSCFLYARRVKEERMKRMLLATLLAVFLLVGCMVVPGRRGSGVVGVPPLPPIVVLEEEPYYYHSGYYYYYQKDRWSYSNSRSGPWVDLPRDRYPKEVRFKGKERGRDDDRGRGDDRDRGEKRGHDERDRY